MTNKILFYRTNDPYGFLNNFYKSRMYAFGYWWHSVEPAYQAMKCLKKEDFISIHQVKTSREAQQLGQKVQLVPHWEEVKLDVMEQCIMAKFTQNHELLKQLLSTEGNELIENSPTDNFWGCGTDGAGQNNLGKILMSVREKLRDF